MRIKILTLLILLVTASHSSADELPVDKLKVFLLGTYAVSATVDVATTQYGLGKGVVVEANPVQKFFTDQGPVVSGIAKSSMHFAIGYYLHKHYDRKAAKIALVGLIAAQVVVDYHNAKVISQK